MWNQLSFCKHWQHLMASIEIAQGYLQGWQNLLTKPKFEHLNQDFQLQQSSSKSKIWQS